MCRRLPATFALLAALVAGGCGSDPASPGDASEPSATTRVPPEATEEASEDPADATTVTSISMRRTGGVAGVHDQWRLKPGDEFSDQAFELASRRSELEAEAAALKDEPVCCDFFVYDLTVRYADGSSLRAVLDEDPQAELLWDLVTAVSDSSRAHPDEPLE